KGEVGRIGRVRAFVVEFDVEYIEAFVQRPGEALLFRAEAGLAKQGLLVQPETYHIAIGFEAVPYFEREIRTAPMVAALAAIRRGLWRRRRRLHDAHHFLR